MSPVDFQKSLLVLSRVPNVGAARIRNLIARFETPERVLNAAVADLARTPNIGEKIAESISRFANSEKRNAAERDAEIQFDHLEKLNAKLVTLWDAAYPKLLKEIYDPPVFLFIRGALAAADETSIGIVGTRYPTDYGKHAAKKFSENFVQHGFSVVSGLAFGVDTLAHTAALDAGGRTIAVLGSGIDKIYTDTKGKLYPRIIESGAIISEEFIGTEPLAENFPKRNRIISGLSLGSLIIESDFKGGALITASYAVDQNREVFALPGSVFSKKSNGTNALIRDGKAKLVLSPDDVLNEFRQTAVHQPELSFAKMPPADLTPEEQSLYEVFGDAAVHIDTLAEKSNMDISDVLILLFELEMKNAVRQLAGKFFQKM
jgi:DNA processing protein